MKLLGVLSCFFAWTSMASTVLIMIDLENPNGLYQLTVFEGKRVMGEIGLLEGCKGKIDDSTPGVVQIMFDEGCQMEGMRVEYAVSDVQNFHRGEPIMLSYFVSPNWDEKHMGIGGGIVMEEEIPLPYEPDMPPSDDEEYVEE